MTEEAEEATDESGQTSNETQVDSEEEDNLEDILATAEDTGIQTTDDGELPNLLEVFDLRGTNQYSFGFAAAQDTASVNRLLEMEEVQNLIPRNMELLWGARPFQSDGGIELYEMKIGRASCRERV